VRIPIEIRDRGPGTCAGCAGIDLLSFAELNATQDEASAATNRAALAPTGCGGWRCSGRASLDLRRAGGVLN
jgi:hypothetical protein